jgi:alpha-tubulin suppressor-like RCC1 family protein
MRWLLLLPLFAGCHDWESLSGGLGAGGLGGAAEAGSGGGAGLDAGGGEAGDADPGDAPHDSANGADAETADADAGDAHAELGCVAFVIAGDTHTCARMTKGGVTCWGDNRYGQLGTGNDKSQPRPVFALLPGVNVSRIYLPMGSGDISADRAVFTCGTTSDSLYCWGDNRYGQLGLDHTDRQLLPVLVGVPGSIARASNGGGHTCAQSSDGALWCWGNNTLGQLGTGDNGQKLIPTQVDASKLGSSVKSLGCGAEHTCALSGQQLYCWGANGFGQLGTGDTKSTNAPTEVGVIGSSVERFSTGAKHTCAYTTEGELWCWGENKFGQLGTGDAVNKRNPEKVLATELGAVSWVSTGGQHSCAIRASDSTLWCWGDNAWGQLGVGDQSLRKEPARVAPEILTEGTVASIYAGGAHTCAVKRDGSVWCWGNNQYRQLGASGASHETAPVQVFPPCESP